MGGSQARSQGGSLMGWIRSTPPPFQPCQPNQKALHKHNKKRHHWMRFAFCELIMNKNALKSEGGGCPATSLGAYSVALSPVVKVMGSSTLPLPLARTWALSGGLTSFDLKTSGTVVVSYLGTNSSTSLSESCSVLLIVCWVPSKTHYLRFPSN